MIKRHSPDKAFCFIFVGFFFLLSCSNKEFFGKASLENEIHSGKLLLAHDHLKNKQAAKAVKVLQDALKTRPDDTKTLNLIGLSYLAAGKKRQAIQSLLKAYSLQPSTLIALNLGAAFIANKNFAKAQLIYAKLEVDKNYEHKERIYLNIGLTYAGQGQQKKALSYYKKAFAENSSYYEAAIRIANSFKKNNKTTKALSYFEKARNLCQVCIEPLEEITMIYVRHNKQNAALLLIKKYIKNKKTRLSDKARAKNLLALIKKVKK